MEHTRFELLGLKLLHEKNEVEKLKLEAIVITATQEVTNL
jgi:hypothetical protein